LEIKKQPLGLNWADVRLCTPYKSHIHMFYASRSIAACRIASADLYRTMTIITKSHKAKTANRRNSIAGARSVGRISWVAIRRRAPLQSSVQRMESTNFILLPLYILYTNYYRMSIQCNVSIPLQHP
jgi:hypothetical protein